LMAKALETLRQVVPSVIFGNWTHKCIETGQCPGKKQIANPN